MGLTRAIAVGVVMCCIVVSGCAVGYARGDVRDDVRDEARPDAATPPATYVVRPQDTLYGIAWRHDVDYRDLAKWNNIGPDYKLSVGQILYLGAPRGRPTSAAIPRPAPTGPTPPPAVRAPPRAAPSPAPAAGAAPRDASSAATGTSAWAWPTDRVSAPRPVPGGGILLLGHLGQDVRAAAAGRVVYMGSGLRGYGNLIIIKHADNLLSSYAHNRDLLVHEGQPVSAGQVIAHMGTGPHQISALYFEIRVNGKPVDPLHYLEPAK